MAMPRRGGRRLGGVRVRVKVNVQPWINTITQRSVASTAFDHISAAVPTNTPTTTPLGKMEPADEKRNESAVNGSQREPRVELIEVAQTGRAAESLSHSLRKILAPAMSDSTPEPDVFRLTLELPSVSTFVRMRDPVPNDVLALYAQAAPGQSTKHLFPAYLRLVAQKWEDIVEEGERQRAP